jgi:putative sigma-54 modulation protein
MQIDYTCRNTHLDDPLREVIEQKVQKIMKFVEEPVEVRVILELEKHRHIAELHITHRLGVVQAKEENEASLLEAVQLAIERAEKQARRSRKKVIDRRRRPVRVDRANNGSRWPVEVLDRASVGGGAVPRVIEVIDLEIKPMTIEEAAMELEATEHAFVVFRDAESERVSVLFKRKDQNYGLIAPEP